MLYQFTFKNFKSYKEETIFDMQAENIEEFSESLLETKSGRKILPVSVIYGPNGGGKSGVLEALVCLISLVIKPIKLLEKAVTPYNIQFAFYNDYKPYMFDKESVNQPTEFEVFFDTGKAEYRYVLSVLKGLIVEEYLYKRDYNSKKPAKIYSRLRDKITLGEILKKENAGTSVNENMPYLTYLAINNSIEIIKDVIGWFTNAVSINYANNYSNDISKLEIEEMKQMLLMILKKMDIDIEDYRIEKRDIGQEIITKHKNESGEFELTLRNESQGTHKLFNLIPNIIDSIALGGIAIIDELDSKLHPKLLQNIIGIYKDKNINKRNAQLIFTSHDLTTMSNKIFRRDEIWFACKDKNKVSEIYSLYDIRDEKGEHIRANANFNKQYIEGRYGADPYLSKILNWEVK